MQEKLLAERCTGDGCACPDPDWQIPLRPCKDVASLPTQLQRQRITASAAPFQAVPCAHAGSGDDCRPWNNIIMGRQHQLILDRNNAWTLHRTGLPIHLTVGCATTLHTPWPKHGIGA